MVRPRLAFSVRISSSSSTELTGSRPADGSSRKSSGGSSAIARAMAARFFMPPEISAGRWFSKPSRPTRRSLARTMASIASASRSVHFSSGSATFSPTVIEPKSAPDWNSTPAGGAPSAPGGAPAVDADRAAHRLLEADQVAEQGRLAAAAAAEDREHLAGATVKLEVLEQRRCRPSRSSAVPPRSCGLTHRPEGVEEDGEDRVDQHDGEQARHDRRGRAAADALGAAAGGEAVLAGDERDREAEDDALQQPRDRRPRGRAPSGSRADSRRR